MDTINKNVTKARMTCYSLLSAGLHGNNGLDPVTSLHLMKTFVIPTLLYIGVTCYYHPCQQPFNSSRDLYQETFKANIFSAD